MGSYLPSTAGQKRQMLEAVGVSQIEALYDNVAGIHPSGRPKTSPPASRRWKSPRRCVRMADKNHVFHTIFRGAGAYDHYIPAIVERVTRQGGIFDRLHPLSGGDQPGCAAIHF